METIYYWIGLVIFWLSASIGIVRIVAFLLKILMDKLGEIFLWPWFITEYVFYRHQFKEWVKDKPRLPIIEDNLKQNDNNTTNNSQ